MRNQILTNSPKKLDIPALYYAHVPNAWCHIDRSVIFCIITRASEAEIIGEDQGNHYFANPSVTKDVDITF